MRVGIPTEIKNNEYRVAITPAGVAELVHRGHEVIVQSGAGEGSAISDADFKRAGAQLITGADQVWAAAELLLKVKEPIEAEYNRMCTGQTLFTYLHLAASRPCTDALMASGTTSIAYETVQTTNPDGSVALYSPRATTPAGLPVPTPSWQPLSASIRSTLMPLSMRQLTCSLLASRQMENCLWINRASCRSRWN